MARSSLTSLIRTLKSAISTSQVRASFVRRYHCGPVT
jgi:hypothetical protein